MGEGGARGRFAHVALDVPLLMTFSYEIPQSLCGSVSAGQLVHVPWRKQSKVGVVVSLSAAPPRGVKNIKPIQSVIDPVPVLDEPMLRMVSVMASYYRAPIGDVIALAVPAGLRRDGKRYFSLTDAGRRAAVTQDRGLPPLTLRALTLVMGSPDGCLGGDVLTKKIKGMSHVVLEQLVADDLLSYDLTLEQPGVAAQTVEWVRLLQLPPATARLGAVQQQVIEALADCDELDMPSLRERIPNARASLKALLSRGIVEVEAREVFRDPFSGEPTQPASRHPLTEEQQAAVDAVLSGPPSGGPGGYQGFLLHGVTGSGKTEVYVQVIRHMRALGMGAVVLLPEIALTPQFCGVFRAHFGDDVAVLHSGLTAGERFDAWRRLRAGGVGIAIGARSALFAPMPRLGVIVVDEEHDPSFKQSESPRYNARDMALVRANAAQCKVILGSATPSLETFYLAHSGKIQHLKMQRRVGKRPLPLVQIVDMADTQSLLPEVMGAAPKDDPRLLERRALSSPLLEAMGEVLGRGEQVIVLLNRRGYSPFVQCVGCGYAMYCPNCSVSLTYHQDTRRLHCHYCDLIRSIPGLCPKCEKPSLGLLGVGTERLCDMLSARFPNIRVERLDRDAGSGSKQRALLSAFRRNEIQVLVGTQMVAKGHDIHNVTLVGVVMADMTLNFPDFRSAERTFQLMTQVAGRAGRGTKPGKVLIQTLSPLHYALQAARFHSYEAFLSEELLMRQELSYPPFAFLIALRFEALEPALVEDCAKAFVSAARAALDPDAAAEVSILGPAMAAVGKVKGRTRYQVLLKANLRPPLRAVLERALALLQPDLNSIYRAVRLAVDIDPISLM
jgi:primosomal protein N' (replication factor Y) (superfamily II helicase)